MLCAVFATCNAHRSYSDSNRKEKHTVIYIYNMFIRKHENTHFDGYFPKHPKITLGSLYIYECIQLITFINVEVLAAVRKAE